MRLLSPRFKTLTLTTLAITFPSLILHKFKISSAETKTNKQDLTQKTEKSSFNIDSIMLKFKPKNQWEIPYKNPDCELCKSANKIPCGELLLKYIETQYDAQHNFSGTEEEFDFISTILFDAERDDYIDCIEKPETAHWWNEYHKTEIIDLKNKIDQAENRLSQLKKIQNDKKINYLDDNKNSELIIPLNKTENKTTENNQSEIKNSNVIKETVKEKQKNSVKTISKTTNSSSINEDINSLIQEETKILEEMMETLKTHEDSIKTFEITQTQNEEKETNKNSGEK